MLDVHVPHHSPNTARDFFFHLFTITIGLLIALGLEGAVEWQHHKHLLHEAQHSLCVEIENNEAQMAQSLQGLHNGQATLSTDVMVLNQAMQQGHLPEGKMSIGFHIHTFDNVAWKTAQATGASALMSYGEAEEYAGIYQEQELLAASEQVAARDTVLALGPLLNLKNGDTAFPKEDAKEMKAKIQALQGQCLIVDSFMQGLDREYKKFLAAHPN